MSALEYTGDKHNVAPEAALSLSLPAGHDAAQYKLLRAASGATFSLPIVFSIADIGTFMDFVPCTLCCLCKGLVLVTISTLGPRAGGRAGGELLGKIAPAVCAEHSPANVSMSCIRSKFFPVFAENLRSRSAQAFSKTMVQSTRSSETPGAMKAHISF